MSDVHRWIAALRAGKELELKPWERLQVLEHVAAGDGDEIHVAAAMADGPIPPYRLEELFGLAVRACNEQIAVALLDAGAPAGLMDEAARNGMAMLCAKLVESGTRMNRLYQGAEAPLHLAARSKSPDETVRALVLAGCDVTVRTPAGERVWELVEPELGEWVREQVGAHGPRWFRDAQVQGVDHYVFVEEDAMIGFNPNDVQTPIWTGDDVEGFGWPNTAAQARALLEDNRILRFEVEWFLSFLDKIEAGEDFSLEDLPSDVPAPRRRPSWR